MSLRAYLQLVRLPAVFTALADIALGFVLNHRTFAPPLDFALLLMASACLYLAGMALNDVFDHRIDALERPSRPIPSGRVPLRSAATLGGVLLVAGVGLAAAVGLQSLWVALGLALCIVGYDGLFKGTWLGPLAMGGCRFLNVMLGASDLDNPSLVWQWPHTIAPAAALGLYIVGVTLFARNEAGESRRGALLLSMVVVNLGLAGLVAWVLTDQTGNVDTFEPLVMLAVVLLTLNRRMTAALFDPSPRAVQMTVRTMLLSLIVLDATLVFYQTGNVMLAVAVLALLLPAMFLGRWIYIT